MSAQRTKRTGRLKPRKWPYRVKPTDTPARMCHPNRSDMSCILRLPIFRLLTANVPRLR
jgi:hypothetical protein